MSCRVRFKLSHHTAFYHVYSRISGSPDDRPLEQSGCQDKLLAIIHHYTRAYCCEVAAFAIMGNHYHLVLRFEPKSQLTSAELSRRAQMLYPGSRSQEIIANWSSSQWQSFNDRLFDLSELLRNIQARFAKWYNQTFARRGRFWATRFKSVLLKDLRAVRDCMIYIDLNPVRASLAERPENYEFCSQYQRSLGQRVSGWLLPLHHLFDIHTSEPQACKDYTYRLCYRGNLTPINSKVNQTSIPATILESEQLLGFVHPGLFLRQIKHFIDGLIIGSETCICEQLSHFRETGQYQRRAKPIPLLTGLFALKSVWEN